jgi:hypothetical protein
MKSKIFTIIMLVSCISVFQVVGKEKKHLLTFKIKGGYHMTSTTAQGDDLISSINDLLYGIRDVEFLDITESKDLQGKLSVPAFGGELELFVRQRLSIALGMEFFKQSSTGYFNANYSEPGYSYDYYREYNLNSFLIPITGVVRYYLSLKRFRAYVGGGIGYYTETIENKTSFSDSYEEGEGTLWKARGKAFIPHLGGGIGYPITKNIMLSLELGFPMGKINSFEIRESSDPEKIGEQLTFYDEDGSVVKYRHNLTGLNFGVFVTLSF